MDKKKKILRFFHPTSDCDIAQSLPFIGSGEVNVRMLVAGRVLRKPVTQIILKAAERSEYKVICDPKLGVNIVFTKGGGTKQLASFKSNV